MRLSNVSSAFGAPMGRYQDPDFGQGKIRLARVPINSGGYDAGGAYWGTGERLWCARDEEGAERFIHAPSRASACRFLAIDVTRLARKLTARDFETFADGLMGIPGVPAEGKV